MLFFVIGFSAKQVNRLYSRFKTLDKRDCGFLTREDLLCIPEVINNNFYILSILLFIYSGKY